MCLDYDVILVLILYGGYEPTSIEQLGMVELNLVRKKRQVANLCLLCNILSVFFCVFIVTIIIIYNCRNVSCEVETIVAMASWVASGGRRDFMICLFITLVCLYFTIIREMSHGVVLQHKIFQINQDFSSIS